eukprot:6101050-Amphidinium_carterae.1
MSSCVPLSTLDFIQSGAGANAHTDTSRQHNNEMTSSLDRALRCFSNRSGIGQSAGSRRSSERTGTRTSVEKRCPTRCQANVAIPCELPIEPELAGAFMRRVAYNGKRAAR